MDIKITFKNKIDNLLEIIAGIPFYPVAMTSTVIMLKYRKQCENNKK